jgi:hypothetical protein
MNIVPKRPDKNGLPVDCDTWDNAFIVCDMEDAGDIFPMSFEMKRMKPGATNEWYLEIHGLKCSAKFTTNDPNAFYFLENEGREQVWSRVVIGNKPLFPTATAGIFEFGFTDAILQMWAAYMKEVSGQDPVFGCFSPEETSLSHGFHTAALESYKQKKIVPVSL